ncbi:auxin-responsive protein SAUR36-like [Triticum aestivum]|nr:auxin-responsive protein SAUR36-like [Triticum aestivum]
MAKCPPNTTTSSTDKRQFQMAKNLAQLAKKWQRVVAMGRKRLTSSTSGEETGGPCGTSCLPVAGKGHFVVYTTDGARFEVPLAFLGTTVFDELLRMSQEEFGFTGVDGGRIRLPCDASMMEYAMFLLRRTASSEMEAAFLNTMVMPCHYHAELHLGVSQHYDVCSS